MDLAKLVLEKKEVQFIAKNDIGYEVMVHLLPTRLGYTVNRYGLGSTDTEYLFLWEVQEELQKYSDIRITGTWFYPTTKDFAQKLLH